jgi:hypothetical protein
VALSYSDGITLEAIERRILLFLVFRSAFTTVLHFDIRRRARAFQIALKVRHDLQEVLVFVAFSISEGFTSNS